MPEIEAIATERTGSADPFFVGIDGTPAAYTSDPGAYGITIEARE